MTSDEARLAELRARHAAQWDIWAVRGQVRTAWCVKPAGRDIAVHEEGSPGELDAWIRRVNALTSAGVTIEFHYGYKVTATATWTSPGSTVPDTYGPAGVPEVLDHAEAALARATREPPNPRKPPHGRDSSARPCGSTTDPGGPLAQPSPPTGR
jgi:hypothetical protein